MKVAVGSLAALLFLCGTSVAADKIRIGMPADAGHFTLQFAQKRGFLKEEGFDAEIIALNGPVANIALASGDIDYFTGFGSSMRAMVQGSLPSRIVACFRPKPHLVMIGRPELKSVKDLKGKTMGGSPGSAPELVGRIILKHFGLDQDRDMKFLRSTSDGAFARMQQGIIDAQTQPTPWDFRARKVGLSILARAEDLFTYPISGIVAHTKKIKEKPDEIRRLIKAGIKASRAMRANRDGTIDLLATSFRLDKETAAALYDSFVKGFNEDGSLPEDGLRRLLDDTRTTLKIDREITFAEVADLAILRSVQRELGIK